MTSSSPLIPTFYGHIASTQDALILFEACLNGALNHVARRPHDRERSSLIKSGNVFIYEEHSSGIKRWTDGVPWSPSRILGNFLVYRELERPFPPGEKKRAMKRSKRSPPGIAKQESYGSSSSTMSSGYSAGSTATSTFDSPGPSSISKETERSLIGSLVDSYGFKEEGLVKKTVSVTVGRVSHHLVSYYTVADVLNNKLSTPSKDPRFQHITPRADLVTKQNFRTPIDEVDSMDRLDDRSPAYPSYSYPRNSYEMTNQSMSSRPVSISNLPLSYTSSHNVFGNYEMNPQPMQYDSMNQNHSGHNYHTQFTPSTTMYQAPKPESYDMSGGGSNTGYRPQRYNSVIGIPSDTARDQLSPATATFPRRTSNLEPFNSMGSALPNMSGPTSDPKPANESGYLPQYYCNSSSSSHTISPHRSLPTPIQQGTFERAPLPAYSSADNTGALRESSWSIGNSSAGHGHYISSQSWSGTGQP